MRRAATTALAVMLALAWLAPAGSASAGADATPLTPEQVATYRVDTDITVANAGFEFIAVASSGAAPDLVIRRAGLAGVHVARVTCGGGYALTPRGRPGQINMVACVGPAATSPKLPATVTII